ncbi:histidinol dehydrogenase [Marinibacterium profundimaris]|uniref:histidinol dehydrogenase n=1 Tax=Marinibacterium profundimaris TaxID=1679460 RepID=UPI000B51F3DA|nr:histidinol dehydrogenase [Marinibacterium profundimaris]
MTIRHLKRADPRPASESADLRETVREMLERIEADGAPAVLDYARTLDHWEGPAELSDEARAAAIARVDDDQRALIGLAHDNIRRFAEAQKATLQDCAVELRPGHWAGQKQIPVASAGCYVPGGRYIHVASALMTITTAKVAGVGTILAASPPQPGSGIPDAVIYAMDLAGADRILTLGGVQAIAAMAFGLFGCPEANILAGPGNSYVAEAKRQLFGRVGIDMFAGPTDSLVLADDSADPEIVAWDLVGQAEHGVDSPVWLATTCQPLAEEVMRLIPTLIDSLPERNGHLARVSWADRGEVMLCDSREEMVEISEAYAPEHLHVQARDLDWWLERLSTYGSLFLGQETTVAFGDKVSGPNHVLPTSGAARYTGGLSVQKFTKTVTWQRTDRAAMPELARATAGISRAEGMAAHAASAEVRLEKLTDDSAKGAAAEPGDGDAAGTQAKRKARVA